MRPSLCSMACVMMLLGSSMAARAEDVVCPSPEERQALMILALRSQVMQVSMICVEPKGNRPFEEKFSSTISDARQDASSYFIRRYKEDATEAFHDYENSLSMQQSLENAKKGFALCHWADNEFPQMVKVPSEEELAVYAGKQNITLGRSLAQECPPAEDASRKP